ncbi:hypothetical protein BN7_6051 [Wickerhamomyces ciferrii]|uniref:PDZ GRASP-type domain-containing protein n=1 Tax=Wickerhamomyces ciferrii (strain ATCC 14091 / BCRC 22168 / CBS 111 / JCM 3599 / NBRC 0793 / NRRL Y-1031 F-60-10) TaxID=1206466 RepID=K0KWQ1_WICCF|nr:uncharacterized protein BN7_6051 [Wickerhamomyces ciferrii]CCH46457.1 hypothetical protein BN7_6051 [Wickerhamomyces ciferrii]
MFAFAQKFVKSIEQSAETIIGGGANDESILQNDAYFSNTKSNKLGLRIINVKPDSLASKAGLESWFDYIIGINGHEIPTNYNESLQLIPVYDYFIQEISNNKSRSIILEIWNAKGGVLKNIELDINELDSNNLDEVPINESNPNFIQQQQFQKLGFQIQWTPLITSTFVYHILEIHPNSPAERAGLIEHSDYIIGAQDGLLATGGEDLLGRLITSKKNESLILYVYNHDYNIVRPVNITPFENWGGQGLLGAGVGYGFLHRLPPVIDNVEPGSILFDDSLTPNHTPNFSPASTPLPNETFQQQTFIPSNLSNPPTNASPPPPPTSSSLSSTTTTTGPPPIHGRKKKSNKINSEMLDYLSTEGEKSRILDNQGKYPNDNENSLPPPPKK